MMGEIIGIAAKPVPDLPRCLHILTFPISLISPCITSGVSCG